MCVRFKVIEAINPYRLRDDQALRITGAESDIADGGVYDPDAIVQRWTNGN
jgi:hypothetical protein